MNMTVANLHELCLAAQDGHLSVVRKLITTGVDINRVGPGGATPLFMHAASTQTHVAQAISGRVLQSPVTGRHSRGTPHV